MGDAKTKWKPTLFLLLSFLWAQQAEPSVPITQSITLTNSMLGAILGGRIYS